MKTFFNDIIYNDVKNRIKYLREINNYDYKALSDILRTMGLRVAEGTLRKYERLESNNKNSVPSEGFYKLIIVLSDVYKVSMDYILYGKEYASKDITIAKICNHLSIDKNTYDQLYRLTNELKAPLAARNTVKMIFDAIFGLDTFPNKVRLTEDEPWKTLGIHQMTVGNYYVYFWINEPEKKVIVTDVIYARRDQVDAMADMPMT